MPGFAFYETMFNDYEVVYTFDYFLQIRDCFILVPRLRNDVITRFAPRCSGQAMRDVPRRYNEGTPKDSA